MMICVHLGMNRSVTQVTMVDLAMNPPEIV